MIWQRLVWIPLTFVWSAAIFVRQGRWRGEHDGRLRRIQGGAVMLARQRQALILERVREVGAVRVAELVRELGVSDMTVRRDLEILDDRGLLEKVHGGATSLTGHALFEPGFAAKSSLQQAREGRDRRRGGGPRRAGHGDRRVRGHDDLRARPAPRRRAGADRGHQLDPGRGRAAPGRAARTRRSC